MRLGVPSTVSAHMKFSPRVDVFGVAGIEGAVDAEKNINTEGQFSSFPLLPRQAHNRKLSRDE